MAIVERLKHGWLIDHREFINNSFEKEVFVNGDNKKYKIVFQEELFRIDGEFLMDSEFTARSNQKSSSTRKRKRKKIADEKEFKELRTIALFLNDLSSNNHCKNYFKNLPKSSEKDNNKLARSLAAHLTQQINLLSIPKNYHLTEKTDKNEISIEGEKFYLPRDSQFLMGNIEDGFHTNERYNLIVIDPPWPNKSAKRLKCYNQLTSDEILQINIKNLSEDNCLLIVWTTGKWKSWVIEEFLGNNDFDYTASWVWLKVTNEGQPVRPLSDVQNKAYEWLIIGKKGLDSMEIDEKVICSVPCALHSSKPPIFEIIKDYTNFELKILEIFARNLNRNCTSWGNQVLNFQHELFFKKDFF